MDYKLMHCYSRKSKLLALIDIDAISEMTWHSDGMYIYWRRNVLEYPEADVTTERVGCIVCDWTKVEGLDQRTVNYLINHGTRVILEDTTIYDWNTIEQLEYIEEKEEPELTEEDIEEGIRCSNL